MESNESFEHSYPLGMTDSETSDVFVNGTTFETTTKSYNEYNTTPYVEEGYRPQNEYTQQPTMYLQQPSYETTSWPGRTENNYSTTYMEQPPPPVEQRYQQQQQEPSYQPNKVKAWRVPGTTDQYEIILEKGLYGLCMNVAVKEDIVTVMGFRRPTMERQETAQSTTNGGNYMEDEIGPAEACGIIKEGDILLAVDNVIVNGTEGFGRAIPMLKSPLPVRLKFQRPNYTMPSVSNLPSPHQVNYTYDPPQQQQQQPQFPLPPPPIDPYPPTRETPPPMVSRFRGVRFLAPDRWLSYVLFNDGLQHILGEFPTEYHAANAYNQFVYRLYGDSGKHLLNNIDRAPEKLQQQQPYPNTILSTSQTPPTPPPQQQPMYVTRFNPNKQVFYQNEILKKEEEERKKALLHQTEMERLYRDMHQTIAMDYGGKSYLLTPLQKDRLRSQIMVFKYVSQNALPPFEILTLALGNLSLPSALEEQMYKRTKKMIPIPEISHTKKLTNRRTASKYRKRKKKSSKYFDEDDDEEEESGSYSDSDHEVKKLQLPQTEPARRSTRNIKRKVYNDTALDQVLEEEEKREEEDQPSSFTGIKAIAMNKLQGLLTTPILEHQIDKILGVRFYAAMEVEMQFLLKWKNMSYFHLSWLSIQEFEKFGIHVKRRLRNYIKKHKEEIHYAKQHVIMEEHARKDRNDEENIYFNEAFLEIDRIILHRTCDQTSIPVPGIPFFKQRSTPSPPSQQRLQYLVKWRDLSYVDCTWENEEEILDKYKISQYYRFNHLPLLRHPATLHDIRGQQMTTSKRYNESLVYANGNILRSYQLDSLNWLIYCWTQQRNCILADEMGLGKTIQAITLLEHLRTFEHIRGPFLIIAPLATLSNWKREIESWTSMNCIVYHDPERGAEVREFIRTYEFYFNTTAANGLYKFHIMITSYHVLMTDIDILSAIHWRYLVVDEAHKIKNKETRILHSMQRLKSDSILLMTGTPLQNGVTELWCLLNFIEPTIFPNQQMFYERYGDLMSATQVSALHEELRPYMLRRTKEDVEKSIPPKEETIIDVELTILQKKYYRAIFERNRQFLNHNSQIPIANLSNIEIELRKCCNHPFLIKGVEMKEVQTVERLERAELLIHASGKTVLLDKILSKFVKEEKKKVLVFSQFKIMLDIIEEILSLRGYVYERMDGSIPSNERQAAIDRFNNEQSNSSIFLLSTRAGGVGINLTAASVVILYDSDWNPQNDLQAVARCHRIGQTKSVRIFRLITQKTYEAQMFYVASKKLGIHQAVFETGGVPSVFLEKTTPKAKSPTTNSNMMSLLNLDKDKIENMIRYGAYAILDNEEGEDTKNIDINEILCSSRIIRYDGTGTAQQPEKGLLSFSKASFTTESAESSSIDFHDEKFWEKVLGPKMIQRLIRQAEEGYLAKASLEELKDYLRELRELAKHIITERQKGGIFEDTNEIISLLVDLKVIGPILPEINVRAIAKEWLIQIEKPKRRRGTAEPYMDDLLYVECLDGKKATLLPQKNVLLDEYLDEMLEPKQTAIKKKKGGRKPVGRGKRRKCHGNLMIQIQRIEGKYRIDRIRCLSREMYELVLQANLPTHAIILNESTEEIIKEEEPICAICYNQRPSTSMRQCQVCKLYVHRDCYPINEMAAEWQCMKCTLRPNETVSCHCCPCDATPIIFEQDTWHHACCLHFKASTPVSSEEKCSLCHLEKGCHQCQQCHVHVHPICALKSGKYKILIEDHTTQWRLQCTCHENEKVEDRIEEEKEEEKPTENEEESDEYCPESDEEKSFI